MESAIQSLFIDLQQTQMKLYPLTALWLDRPIQMPDRKTSSIKKGDLFRIKNGVIVDCFRPEQATHEFIGGKGRLDSSELYIDVIDLKTEKTLTIKIN